MEPFFDSNSSAEALKKVIFSGPRKPSIQQVSKRLGFSSDRGLGMVLRGQRLPSSNLLLKIAQKYHLDPRGVMYLNLLVQRDRLVKRSSPTSDVDRRLQELKSSNVKYRKATNAQLKAIQAWWCLPTVTILQKASKPMNVETLRQLLRGDLPTTVLRKGLNELVQAELLSGNDSDGYSVPGPEFLRSGLDIPSTTIRAIHRAQLLRAIDTIEEQGVLDRDLMTKSLMIPLSQIPRIKKTLLQSFDALSDEMVALEDDGDQVVIQLNLQMFQQSKAIPKKDLVD